MVSVMLYPCMFCVALSMDLFVLCVACFDGVCELFVETLRNMFGCVFYSLRSLLRHSLHLITLAGKLAGCTLEGSSV